MRTWLISFALALYVLLPWQDAHSQLTACIIIEIPADAEAPIGDARDKGGAEKQATRLSTPRSREQSRRSSKDEIEPVQSMRLKAFMSDQSQTTYCNIKIQSVAYPF